MFYCLIFFPLKILAIKFFLVEVGHLLLRLSSASYGCSEGGGFPPSSLLSFYIIFFSCFSSFIGSSSIVVHLRTISTANCSVSTSSSCSQPHFCLIFEFFGFGFSKSNLLTSGKSTLERTTLPYSWASLHSTTTSHVSVQ
jgi:hypothetical protein